MNGSNMREKTFPWTKIKGNPRARTVHIGLKTSTPDYWSRMTEGLQSVFRKKKRGKRFYQIMYLIMKITENVE